MNRLKIILTILFFASAVSTMAQRRSVAVGISPISVWENDLSTGLTFEYRFHPSFSLKFGGDYIYSLLFNDIRKTKADGFRFRQEFRYYFNGNKRIESDQIIWPYVGIGYGNKWINTNRSDWVMNNTASFPHQQYISFDAKNHEWYMLGKGGVQFAVDGRRRFLVDVSLSVGRSKANINYQIPDDAFYKDQIITKYSWNNRKTNFSGNLRNGNYWVLNFETNFSYRFGK